jgi:hypothetical protein
MTKRSLERVFLCAVVGFLVLWVIGLFLSIWDTTDKRTVFGTYKDLLPLFLGIAAAVLGFFAQRRAAYVQQLRVLWSKLVEAVVLAQQYTYIPNPTRDQFSEVQLKLSIAIEEVRGVFSNLDESDRKDGLYPFEPLKDIYRQIEGLEFGDRFKAQEAEKCRKKIETLWKAMRKEISKEFDREEPTFPHSHWNDPSHEAVYDKHSIPKKPS